MAAAALALTLPPPAQAGQPRDFMIAAGRAGTQVNLDVIFPGFQANVEHRIPIYGIANELTLRANGLYTLAFGEAQADVELRMLVLTLGGSVGYQKTLRNLAFAPDERIDREQRRDRELDGSFNSQHFGFAEGRATLSLPFNDYAVFNWINTMRYEPRQARSLDYRNGVVHDGGMLYRADLMLLAKHRDWGGFGPVAQLLSFELDNRRWTTWQYGFAFVTRPGFRRRDDIFFLQVLLHPGATLADDNSKNYGMHLLFSPINITLAYRMVLPVWRPE